MEKKNKTHMYRQIYLQMKTDCSWKKSGSMALVYFSTGKQNKTKRTTKNRQRANEKGVNKNTKQIIIFFTVIRL